jgi:pimeloyl-ACP methyl ester carboxylesterase
MNKPLRTVLIVLVVLVIVLAGGPFLIPVEPLTNTVSALELAREDSHFMTIRFIGTDGIDLHYRDGGRGETTFILLHSYGGNVYTFNPVFEQFASDGHVIAYDRIPFGLSERIDPDRWSGANPYSLDAAVSHLVGVMDELRIQQAVLGGHSSGGLVALKMALEHPDRVQALILADPAVYSNPGISALASLSRLPQVDHLGPLTSRYLKSSIPQLVKQSFHDPARFTDADLAEMDITFQVTDWDMALWEYSKAQGPSDVPQRLGEITMPTLVIVGDDDRVVPMTEHEKLAQEIPGATLVTVAQAGHLPFVEQPDEFMKVVDAWLKEQGLVE